MRTDILFVNCWNAEFPYIPMGTFGLCDYLDQHDIHSRIINLSLYPREESNSRLISQIAAIQPKNIGLILHWKELLNSVIQTGSLLRDHFPDIPIIMGGMTASYYSVELMENLRFVDYIIKGDSEIPLLHLLNGTQRPESIENMVCRQNGSVVHSPNHFLSDSDLLNSISFSRLDFLEDYPLYLQRLDEYLGFPIFVGRGCIFDCEYCGGSRSAFLKHSGRKQLTARNTENIVRDILVLTNQYDCKHVLLSHLVRNCKPIIKGLLSSPHFQGKVRMDLEPWDYPDRELIKLHEEVSKGAARRPCIILTPKSEHADAGHFGCQDKKRRNPSLDQLTVDESVDLAQYCHTDIFKGYFTSNHTDLGALFQDMAEVHHIRKRHAGKDISVHFLAFSTDPASRLSEANPAVSSDLSLAAINQAILFDRNLSTNILMHRPNSVSQRDQQTFERVLAFSEFLFLNTPFVYWLLTEDLGFENYLSIVENASQYYFYDLENSAYEISPSNTVLALNCLKTSLGGHSISKPYIIEALNLQLKQEVAKRLQRQHQRMANGLPKYLTLNRDRIFSSSYNFEKILQELAACSSIDKSSINDLQESDEQSLYLLLDNSLIRLPIEELSILQMFDGILDTPTITRILKKIKDAELEQVEQRIKTLHEQGVLIDR